MTPEQEALVEALKTNPLDPCEQSPLGVLHNIRFVRVIVLALADERDLWRLKAEWQEACHKWERAMRLHCRNKAWDDEINRLEYAAVQARAAYVAAGGVA